MYRDLTKNRIPSCCASLFKLNKKTHFWKESSHMLKSGLFIKMWNEKGPMENEEGDAMYLVRLDGHGVLRAPSAKSELKKILYTIGPIKSSNRWKTFRIVQLEGYRLLLGQRQTSGFFADPTYIGIDWFWYLTTTRYPFGIAPSEYHLVWSLQNSLSGKNFKSLEAGEINLD